MEQDDEDRMRSKKRKTMMMMKKMIKYNLDIEIQNTLHCRQFFA
jgi:hypothetical protein